MMSSHEGLQKMQVCQSPKVVVLEVASILEVESTQKAGGYQTNHTEHLGGEETERESVCEHQNNTFSLPDSL